MWTILLPVLELAILFLLSGFLTRRLSRLFHRLTGSRKMTIYFISILFLPGTLIHELSHFLMAVVLFVPTGRLSLIPEMQSESSLRMGSLEVGKSDPVRGILVGVAPIIIGTALIVGSLYLVIQYGWLTSWWSYIIMGFVLFEVGNTMFSSRKDLEGALELLLLGMILAIALYFVGVRPPHINWQALLTPPIQHLLHEASIYLAIPVVIDLAILGVLSAVKNPVY